MMELWTVEIKEITAADLDQLLTLYKHLHESDSPLPPKKDVDNLWQEIQANPDLKYFGVFVDKMLVSTCTLSVLPNLTRGCRPYGVIENVVTNDSFRRRGYAKAVLNHALSYAWGRNCYKVMLMTGRKSEDTFRFYESAGFDMHAKQAFIAKP